MIASAAPPQDAPATVRQDVVGNVPHAPGAALAKCTDPKSLRWMSAINVTPCGKDHVVFTASDSRVLVAVKTEGHIDRPRMIDRKTLPVGRRKRSDGPDITFHDATVANCQFRQVPYCEGRYPEFRDAIPELKNDPENPSQMRAVGSDLEYLAVHVDAELLIRMVEACAQSESDGRRLMTLLVPRDGSAPVLAVSTATQAVGAVMPMTVGQSPQEVASYMASVCQTVKALRS